MSSKLPADTEWGTLLAYYHRSGRSPCRLSVLRTLVSQSATKIKLIGVKVNLRQKLMCC